MMNQKNKTKDRNEFIEEIESKINEKITGMELAELRANDETLNALGLVKEKAKPSLWGLILLAEKSLYYYVPAVTATYFSIPVAKDGDKKAEDQSARLTGLRELSFTCEKPSFLKAIFLPEASRTIDVSFADGEANTHTFALILNNKNTEIIKELDARK